MDYALPQRLRWPLWATVTLGTLVFLAPWLLDRLAPAAFEAQSGFINNMLVQGVLVAIIAWLAVSARPGLAWLNVPLGLWLALSPLVYEATALADGFVIVAGLTLAGLALLANRRRQSP